MNNKNNKSSWASTVSTEKRELFEERAETILVLLKQRFPGIPQSALDISKIQYNKDVGQAVLESYSRILESLAFTVISRIEDVMYADSLTQNPDQVQTNRGLTMSSPVRGSVKLLNPFEEMEKVNAMEMPTSVTLWDFMGWQMMDQESEVQKKESDDMENMPGSEERKLKSKPPSLLINKKISYIEKLENLGNLRSPTSRLV